MQFDGAVVKEQGIIFSIILVKPHILSSSSKEQIRTSFKQYFGNIPIILMSQNSRGIPTYDGRPDIVRFLAKTNPARIPWKRFNITV